MPDTFTVHAHALALFRMRYGIPACPEAYPTLWADCIDEARDELTRMVDEGGEA